MPALKNKKKNRLLSFIAVAALSCALSPRASMAQDTNTLMPMAGDEGTAQIVEIPLDAPSPPQVDLNEPSPIIPQVNAPRVETQTLPDNVFYDAEALVPSSEQAQKGGVKFVDPRKEPGSRLVLVEKNHRAGAYKSNLVSAQRAIKLGRYESALEILDALYAKNKKDPAILMAQAVAYQKLGRDDFAAQAYGKLLELRPENVGARINMLGIIAQKYPSVTLRQLLDLKQENPNNTAIAAQLSVVYAALGKYDEAIRHLGVAASMEPKNAAHIFNMAIIADRGGERDMAIKYYEQALETDALYGKSASIPRDLVFERLADLR